MNVQHWIGLLIVCLAVSSAQRVVRVGNEIKESTVGADWPHSTFLLADDALKKGVLFAFSAWFRNKNQAIFQIWRPVDLSTKTFKLIHSWPITPVVTNQREDVYLHTTQGFSCVSVEANDRVGIYSPGDAGSVVYTFNTNSPETYNFVQENATLYPSAGETVQFSDLTFPYKFSAAAYVDTAINNYPDLTNPNCPTNIAIPSDDQIKTEITQGATGATGPLGLPGATGMSGPMGGTGYTGYTGHTGEQGPQGSVGATGPAGNDGSAGPKGDKGDTGEQGPPGPPGQQTVIGAAKGEGTSDCSWCEMFMNAYVILGLLVWVAVVTIALIVTIIVQCCRKPHYAQNMRYAAGADNRLWNQSIGNGKEEYPPYDNGEIYSNIEEGRTAF